MFFGAAESVTQINTCFIQTKLLTALFQKSIKIKDHNKFVKMLKEY